MKTIVLTGAAGNIGKVLRQQWSDGRYQLRLNDINPLGPMAAHETQHIGDLRDAAFCSELLAGADAVVHMAGIGTDLELDLLIEHNLKALLSVYQAARSHAVRVIYASSNHAIGMYPVATEIDEYAAVRPDSLYGVSKVWGEAVARLYYDKHGVESVCLRIGSFEAEPFERRHLHTWLSHSDMQHLAECCIEAPHTGFQIMYGVSANTRCWWQQSDNPIGYQPQSNAEDFAARIADIPSRGGPLAEQFQGGGFAATDYSQKK
ncbi:uronate dehydrogenase [Collimonas sp. OK242]|jgi:uronate dehydrogenase|uniref:NAD-dependent epimerase/dehydratase family protein n=1 Tax=Collimonas sp. OK242 TaxID=1798195 RepID=UPI00089505E4|nr:NAD(P)-dependent oxidoreductase [Collimonas sp. OK242]SDX52596.1 uronate dehydrogenase [Collimonas sp. OK242]